VNYDDETVMAYADGELDEATRAAIGAAIEQDPELARRVQRHRELKASVFGAYATVAAQPVPERLLQAARQPADAATRSGKVVPFPARAARPPSPPWRAREWTAMAASLVVGVLLSWRFLSPASEPDLVASGGSLVARGALAAALNDQLASEQGGEAGVLIGLTFPSTEGYCRSFVVRSSGTAGLACHADGEWRVPATSAVDLQQGEFRMVDTDLPAAILQAIESRRAGDVLDAEGERAARDEGWAAPR
jgi:hypothetical protein